MKARESQRSFCTSSPRGENSRNTVFGVQIPIDLRGPGRPSWQNPPIATITVKVRPCFVPSSHRREDRPADSLHINLAFADLALLSEQSPYPGVF